MNIDLPSTQHVAEAVQGVVVPQSIQLQFIISVMLYNWRREDGSQCLGHCLYDFLGLALQRYMT